MPTVTIWVTIENPDEMSYDDEVEVSYELNGDGGIEIGEAWRVRDGLSIQLSEAYREAALEAAFEQEDEQ